MEIKVAGAISVQTDTKWNSSTKIGTESQKIGNESQKCGTVPQNVEVFHFVSVILDIAKGR